ncbi:MAG: D-amino-acid dehydrogenase [Alphaproteobacteria bacterium]|nr:MAG: D-amino-acid dehydrogenase [Alphaproteobacteria bacterium]
MTKRPAFDVAVLGAGMVGVASAIHLARRGASVVLVDRRGPGEETSHGNAGIIQREGVHPYLFPRSPLKLVQYAMNLRPEAHYQLASLPAVAPFLWRYWRASAPGQARRTLAANIPLFAACLETHGELAAEAGAEALIARQGWLRLLRAPAAVAEAQVQLAELRALGLDAVLLSPSETGRLEPHLATGELAGAVHYRDPWTVSDPGALVRAYARLFERLGGTIRQADASKARRDGGHWRIGDGLVAGRIVVALGPWSKAFLAARGLKLPMGVKRGYHRHYRPAGAGVLNRPVVDDANGFVLAPMAAGIRLTTGAEFARLEAPATPVQLARCLPIARRLFDLGEPVEAEAWLGARPVMPDMLPVIGEAPGLPGAFLNFGHAHHGFTLGPASGRLLAQMMAGETPFCDPSPYSAGRFL